jgi:hypothetical protein
MQCNQNLILPIVVPVVSYLFFKSFSSGVSSASLVNTDAGGIPEEDMEVLIAGYEKAVEEVEIMPRSLP